MTQRVALVLEDEAIIAMDVAQCLEEEGYAVHTLASRAGAAQWLGENPTPTVAVLDVSLADGNCDDIATALAKRGVPFVVHSAGMKPTSSLEAAFAAGIWLSKPSTTEALIEAVRQAVSVIRAADELNSASAAKAP
jgi:CheY-like chemotaxis protein